MHCKADGECCHLCNGPHRREERAGCREAPPNHRLDGGAQEVLAGNLESAEGHFDRKRWHAGIASQRSLPSSAYSHAKHASPAPPTTRGTARAARPPQLPNAPCC
jgi:hypothetical protein